MLAGVEPDLLDPGLAQRGADRPGLDELRTVPDDGEDLHRREATGVGPLDPGGTAGYRRGVKVAGLLCAVVLAAALVACGSQSATAGGFNPDPVFPVGPISDTASHQIPKLDQVASTLAGKHAT